MAERPVTLLHVDDNETNRYVVGRILRNAGFNLVQAGTGEDALRLARQDPDLILLDVQLPDIDGRTVCRTLKSDLATSHIMILQISAAFVRTEDRVQSLEGGADGYLTYPLEPSELIANITALLRIRRAEEEARLAARQWETTFDAISEGIALVNLDGSIVRCSRKMADLAGKPFGELLGSSLAEAASPLFGELALLKTAIASDQVERESVEVPVGDLWYAVSADPVIDRRGQKTGTVFIFADITNRRQAGEALRASNQRLRLLSETAGSLLLYDEPEEFIKSIFGRLSHHLGLEVYFNYLVTPDGSGLRLASYAGIPPAAAERISRLGFGQAVCGRTAEERRARVEEHIQESNSPNTEVVRELGLTAYACHPLLARDQLIGTVSFGSRKRASFTADELALIQIVSDQVAVALERSRLFTELQRRASQLAQADQAKDEFLAMLSHELRNPLGAISNALHVMEVQSGDEDPQAESRATVRRQVHHLNRMVDDLLDVSRITRGKIDLRKGPVEFGALVRGTLQAAEGFIAERGHRLTVSLPEEPLWIQADATRIEQVVANLVNNAAKYTERGGDLFVALSRQSADGQHGPAESAVLRVRDTGVGIRTDMLPRVFELFAQEDQSLERSQGGLGIGLTLVRTLVTLHGGKVEAASAGSGKGSEFTVILPLSAAPETTEAPQPEPVGASLASGLPLRILVVEDLEDARETLQELLQLWGYQVDVAKDGVEALERIVGNAPDLALVDIGLPGLDGYEVARRVRLSEVGGRVKLIALTGYGLPEDRERALNAGFDDHLVKPVNPEQLGRILGAPGVSNR